MRRLSPKPSIILLGLLLSAVPALAQSTGAGGKADFSKEALVIENSATRVAFAADGTATTESTATIRIQSEAGLQAFGLLSFSYAKANEDLEVVFVRVRKPDGTVVTTPPENAQDMPAEITRSAPFYSDLREVHVAVRGLAVGDTLEFLIRTHLTKPQVPGQFWYAANFSKDTVVKSEELEVKVPKEKYVNVKSHDVQPTVREEGAYRIYSWKRSNVEVKPPAKKSSVPTREEAPPPAVELTTFHSWEEIGRWYDSLQQERVAVTPEIRAKALELTKGKSSDKEKAQALYQYVSGHFRYIALSFGIGRYQPHAAADVLANEYGDCKDKHTVLAALLKAVGVQAWPVLINSQREIEADLPSPAQFDHLITAVQLDGGITWLDTTPEVAPYGYLMRSLRDKEGLVVYDKRPAALVRTPSTLPFPTDLTFTSDVKLGSDGVLSGHMERIARGDVEVLLRAAFRSTPRSRWEELAQQLSYGTGFGGTVSKVESNALEEPNGPFRLSYEYTRKDYADWENRRIVAPLPPLMTGIGADEEKPKAPIFLGAPGEVKGKARLELPPGYILTPPPTINLVEDFGEYRATYRVEKGVLLTERRLIIKKEEVSPSEWEKLQKFAKALTDDYGRFMDLKSISGDSGISVVTVGGPIANAMPPLAIPATSEDPEAKKLLEKVDSAMRGGAYVSAEEYMRQALTKDPKMRDGWATLAFLTLVQNRPNEAIENFQKELELHPDNLRTYRVLADIQNRFRKPREAIETYRRLLKVAPDDGEALRNAGQLLLDEKQFAEAAGYLERATEQDPDSANLQLQLGRAYLGQGNSEKAKARFDKAVALDPSALMLNDVAYSLADEGVELTRSLEYAKKAVAAVEAETQGMSLADLKMSDLNRVRLLSAYWDTLGWVYFQSGDLEKAEAYLRPAWLLSQEGTVGDHLGQVYEKRGKMQEAAHLYELAVNQHAGPETSQRLERVRAKAGPPHPAPMKKAGGGVLLQPPGPGEELSRMRTTRIGAIAGIQDGSAEFFILLKEGGSVEAVKFISGKQELRAAQKALSAAHFDQPLPPGSQAKIVRRGFLSCSPYTKGCDFVTLNPNLVRSLE